MIYRKNKKNLQFKIFHSKKGESFFFPIFGFLFLSIGVLFFSIGCSKKSLFHLMDYLSSEMKPPHQSGADQAYIQLQEKGKENSSISEKIKLVQGKLGLVSHSLLPLNSGLSSQNPSFVLLQAEGSETETPEGDDEQETRTKEALCNKDLNDLHNYVNGRVQSDFVTDEAKDESAKLPSLGYVAAAYVSSVFLDCHTTRFIEEYFEEQEEPTQEEEREVYKINVEREGTQRVDSAQWAVDPEMVQSKIYIKGEVQENPDGLKKYSQFYQGVKIILYSGENENFPFRKVVYFISRTHMSNSRITLKRNVDQAQIRFFAERVNSGVKEHIVGSFRYQFGGNNFVVSKAVEGVGTVAHQLKVYKRKEDGALDRNENGTLKRLGFAQDCALNSSVDTIKKTYYNSEGEKVEGEALGELQTALGENDENQNNISQLMKIFPYEELKTFDLDSDEESIKHCGFSRTVMDEMFSKDLNWVDITEVEE